jgi:hypothetical protein
MCVPISVDLHLQKSDCEPLPRTSLLIAVGLIYSLLGAFLRNAQVLAVAESVFAHIQAKGSLETKF